METSQDLFKQLDEAEALFSKGSIKNAQKKVRDVMSKTKGIGKIPNKLRHKLNLLLANQDTLMKCHLLLLTLKEKS